MKHRLIELGKDVLILLLTLSILVLTLMAIPARTLAEIPWLSSALGPFAGVFGLSRAELTYTEKALPGLDAAQPLAVSVRSSVGRYSAQYDFSALDGLYEAFGGVLGRALETAGELEQTTLQKFYAALTGTGVSFRYPAELPSDVLASWLGAQPQTDGFAASVYVLSVQEGGNARLYLYGSECRVCDTAVSGEELLESLDDYRPDGSLFAMEDVTGVYSGIEPTALIPGASPTVYAASAADPCETRFITSLASSLGFNPYGDASYTDAAGNAFFSETDASLRISGGGQLLLTAADTARFSASSDSAESRIEAARALLEQITGSLTTDARLYLSGYAETEDGAVCTFDYVLGGIPVLLSGREHAATAVFSGRSISELSLLLRTYTLDTQTLSLIPAAQAAAILPEGSALQIRYNDTGADTLSAGWKKG